MSLLGLALFPEAWPLWNGPNRRNPIFFQHPLLLTMSFSMIDSTRHFTALILEADVNSKTLEISDGLSIRQLVTVRAYTIGVSSSSGSTVISTVDF